MTYKNSINNYLSQKQVTSMYIVEILLYLISSFHGRFIIVHISVVAMFNCLRIQ